MMKTKTKPTQVGVSNMWIKAINKYFYFEACMLPNSRPMKDLIIFIEAKDWPTLKQSKYEIISWAPSAE